MIMELKVIDQENIHYLVRNLEDFEKDKAIRSGLRSAASVFMRKGKTNLRARMRKSGKVTGNLESSFTTRVKRRKLGALSGFTQSGSHAHLVDMGTRKRPHPLTGTSGIMPGNSFWSDARKSEEAKAERFLYDGLKRAIQRINERR